MRCCEIRSELNGRTNNLNVQFTRQKLNALVIMKKLINKNEKREWGKNKREGENENTNEISLQEKIVYFIERVIVAKIFLWNLFVPQSA